MLVARVIASNDTRAFGELIQRHQSQIRNFLRRLTRDESQADDLAQDAFMHAWNKIDSYSGRGSFIGWLLKVAYTTFLQSKRKRDRYDEVLKQVGNEGGSVEYASASDEISDLDRFLAVLNEQERAVMIMSYACGLSHREIHEATELPTGTIKSIIYRAKDKIRESFDIEHHQHG
ncbi:MAG: RNA polymerase sigma factor [Pseudomonadota bacterium]